MWIDRIQIRNYRCFGDDVQTLRAQKGFNVIVGENNTGKSSVFQAALHAIGGGTVDAPDAPFGSTARASLLLLDVNFEEDGLALQQELIGPELTALSRNRVSLHADLNTQLRDLFQIRARLEVQSQSGALESKLHLNGLDLSQLRSKPDRPLKPFVSFLTEGPLTVAPPLKERLIGHPDNIGFEKNLRAEVSGFLTKRIRRFSDVRRRPEGSASGAGTSIMESYDGVGTADLLSNLMHGDPSLRKRFDRIQALFQGFFPHLKFIVRMDPSRTPYLVFNRTGFEFDIPPQQAGTGVFEILTLVANLEGRERHIFVVEEPGCHLHPQAQRAMQRVVRDSAMRNQVFIVTHSPEFVDWMDLRGLTRVAIKGAYSELCQLPEDLSVKDKDKLAEALRDVRRREMLFARAVGLVEGASEQGYFRSLAPRVGCDLDSRSVSIIDVSGEGDFTTNLRYLKALQIPVRCFRDKPPTGIADEWKPLFHTHGGKEFEGFMMDQGFGVLFDEAKREVGESKARQARYLGEKIPPERTPEVHRRFLQELCEIAEPVKAASS